MKVLELKEAPYGYPGWWALKIEGKDFPILVHHNYFAVREKQGLPHLKVGDEVEFDDTLSAGLRYTNPSEYHFVKNFHVKDEGEVV